MSGSIKLSVENGVARLLIEDPQRHNAMSLDMWHQLSALLGQIDSDPQIRVCVMRGAGNKAFVSGANISEFETVRNSSETTGRYNQAVKAAQGAVSNCKVPVIAAIQGVCYGGGLGLAMACDLRYASPDARFRLPAARLGLGYGAEGIASMLENMRASAVAEALYRAKVYSAQEALATGMINAITVDVHATVDEIAREIASNAPLTIQAGKLAIRAALGRGSPEQARQAVAACFESQDYREGRQAFAEKRAPHFRGV